MQELSPTSSQTDTAVGCLQLSVTSRGRPPTRIARIANASHATKEFKNRIANDRGTHKWKRIAI